MAKVKWISRRAKYEREWAELAEIIPMLERAAADFADGKIQAYALSSHNVSRNFASLTDLLDFLNECELEYEELDNVLHGRSRRYVEHNYYQNPTNIRFWR